MSRGYLCLTLFIFSGAAAVGAENPQSPPRQATVPYPLAGGLVPFQTPGVPGGADLQSNIGSTIADPALIAGPNAERLQPYLQNRTYLSPSTSQAQISPSSLGEEPQASGPMATPAPGARTGGQGR